MSINLSFNQIDFDKAISVFSTISPSIRMLKFECAETGAGVEQFTKFMAILSPTIKSYDWGCFHCTNEAHILYLLQILPDLPKNVNFLKLSKHRFSRPLVGKLFSTLPAWIKYLDLSDNHFHKFSIKDLKELAGSLPHITTVTLSYDEIFQMTSEQRVLFKAIFNTIERVLFVDDRGETINNSPSNNVTQFLLELGVDKPPSLLNICSFYAVKNRLNLSNVPLEVQEKVQYPIGNFFEH